MALYTLLLYADDIAYFNHYLFIFALDRVVPYFGHCSYTPGNEMKVGVKPFSRMIVVLNNVDKCEILIRPPY